MRMEILDDKGEVANTIIADEAFCDDHFPGRWRAAPEEVAVDERPVQPVTDT